MVARDEYSIRQPAVLQFSNIPSGESPGESIGIALFITQLELFAANCSGQSLENWGVEALL